MNMYYPKKSDSIRFLPSPQTEAVLFLPPRWDAYPGCPCVDLGITAQPMLHVYAINPDAPDELKSMLVPYAGRMHLNSIRAVIRGYTERLVSGMEKLEKGFWILLAVAEGRPQLEGEP